MAGRETLTAGGPTRQLHGDSGPTVERCTEALRLGLVDDYDIGGAGWTYQYSTREHLWPFGHGLSYTRWEYSNLAASVADGALTVSVTVRNAGSRPGSEVVQLYAKSLDGGSGRPPRRLHGFEKLALDADETRTVVFDLDPASLGFWNESAGALVADGRYEIHVGASAEDVREVVAVRLDGLVG